MSIVSSYFSSRSAPLGINAQVASIMDSIFAIAFGLGVRFVIDLVSHHDLKLTGTLVGLWEGVVMQHFLRKMPASFDPYVGYGVRLFVDFLFTESVSRLVLVLVWTGMGVILADITPALWVDVGLRRIWRRFRRDLYYMSRSIPSVPLFTKPRTVRFSPSRTASVISTAAPTVVTNTPQAPSSSRLPPTPALRKRAVPGAFTDEVSDTETDIGSVLGLRGLPSEASTTPGTAHHRFSTFTKRRPSVETDTELSSVMNDLDEGNISSSESSTSTSTETVDPSAANPSEIPDVEDDGIVAGAQKREESDRETTPKQHPITMPPTPSDSALPLHGPHDEPYEVQPPTADVPTIPDHLDDGGWENVDRNEAVPSPPAPPAKDGLRTASTAPTSLPRKIPPPSESLPSSSTEQHRALGHASTPPITKKLTTDVPQPLKSTIPSLLQESGPSSESRSQQSAARPESVPTGNLLDLQENAATDITTSIKPTVIRPSSQNSVAPHGTRTQQSVVQSTNSGYAGSSFNPWSRDSNDMLPPPTSSTSRQSDPPPQQSAAQSTPISTNNLLNLQGRLSKDTPSVLNSTIARPSSQQSVAPLDTQTQQSTAQPAKPKSIGSLSNNPWSRETTGTPAPLNSNIPASSQQSDPPAGPLSQHSAAQPDTAPVNKLPNVQEKTYKDVPWSFKSATLRPSSQPSVAPLGTRTQQSVVQPIKPKSIGSIWGQGVGGVVASSGSDIPPSQQSDSTLNTRPQQPAAQTTQPTSGNLLNLEDDASHSAGQTSSNVVSQPPPDSKVTNPAAQPVAGSKDDIAKSGAKKLDQSISRSNDNNTNDDNADDANANSGARKPQEQPNVPVADKAVADAAPATTNASPTAANTDPAPTPSSSSTETVLTGTDDKLKAEALAYRLQAAALDKDIVELERQREAALSDGEEGAGLALEKKGRIEAAEKEKKKLHKKADRRYIAAANKSEGGSANPSTEIDFAEVPQTEAVTKLEEALHGLLAPGQKATNLTVKLAQGSKGKKQKQKLVPDLKERGLSFEESDPRVLIISLPSVPSH